MIKTLEMFLALEFKDKFSNFNFIVCVCYLPPECNRNGRDSQAFFDHLTNLMYRTNDFDFCLYLGDINARCGNESDLVTLVDNSHIGTRSCIDDVKNPRGPVFIDFLKSVNYCLLNGRVNPDMDNFTCISHKGRSVVDYMFVPHENLSYIESFAVLPVTDLCHVLNVLPERAMPDHSILKTDIHVHSFIKDTETSSSCNGENLEFINVPNERMFFKHKRDVIPETFMCNDYILQNINDAIRYIEQRERNNVEIDIIYDNICNIYYNEMDSKLKYFDSRSPKRARRTLKPWWNEDLASLFDQYRNRRKCI